MDPFSITAGAIGITGVAMTSIQQLYSLISDLAEADEIMLDLTSSLHGIERPLAALRQLSVLSEATTTAAKEVLRNAGVADAVNGCGDACEAFAKNLQKWTKHSSTTKLSLRDRFSIGVWNKEKIQTFKTHLQSCETTVQFAVASAQLLVQLRSERLSEVNRENLKGQLQTLETKIQRHLDITKKQQEEAHEREQKLQEELREEEDGGAQQTLAIQEIQEQLRLLAASQISCGVVFSQVRSRRSGQEIDKVITLDNSEALVGLSESVVGKINQRIGEVRTERGSRAIVGVFGSDIKLKST